MRCPMEPPGVWAYDRCWESWGCPSRLYLHTDSSAAKSFASRRSIGTMRHLEVKDLWLQAAVKEGKGRLYKVNGEEDPADLLTKYLDLPKLRALTEALNISVT